MIPTVASIAAVSVTFSAIFPKEGSFEALGLVGLPWQASLDGFWPYAKDILFLFLSASWRSMYAGRIAL